MNKPLISVIIPAYNAEAFLAETIQSVLAQTWSELELLVVNDGSKDGTEQVAQSFSDPRLQYIPQQNGGVSNARNNGFAHSKGSYVAFLDADDVLLPDNLTEKMNRFAQDEALGLVHGDMEVVTSNTERTGRIMAGLEGELLERLLLWEETCIPTPSSILVKREVVEKVGGFDPTLSNNADMEFFFRVAHQYPIGRVKKVLALYRDHENNMHKNMAVMEKDTLLAYQRAKEHRLFPSKTIKAKAFSNMYLTLAGSWIKDHRNFIRGSYFLLRGLIAYPANARKYLQKKG